MLQTDYYSPGNLFVTSIMNKSYYGFQQMLCSSLSTAICINILCFVCVHAFFSFQTHAVNSRHVYLISNDVCAC